MIGSDDLPLSIVQLEAWRDRLADRRAAETRGLLMLVLDYRISAIDARIRELMRAA